MTPDEIALEQFEEFINDTNDEVQDEERMAHSDYQYRTNTLASIMNAIMVGEFGDASKRAEDLHKWEMIKYKEYLEL